MILFAGCPLTTSCPSSATCPSAASSTRPCSPSPRPGTRTSSSGRGRRAPGGRTAPEGAPTTRRRCSTTRSSGSTSTTRRRRSSYSSRSRTGDQRCCDLVPALLGTFLHCNLVYISDGRSRVDSDRLPHHAGGVQQEVPPPPIAREGFHVRLHQNKAHLPERSVSDQEHSTYLRTS